MRWMKHITMAHADEALSAILEEHGAEAYGIWWLILEDIASAMDPKNPQPTATHSLARWASICHCSTRHWKVIGRSLSEKGLMTFQWSNERIQITVHNILKYKDEYSNRSGQTPEQEHIQNRYRVENRINTSSPPGADGEKSAPAEQFELLPEETSKRHSLVKPSPTGFDEFWRLYWRKVGKEPAKAAYTKRAQSPKDIDQILVAVKTQSAAMLALEERFRPHAATWLNQGRMFDEASPPQRGPSSDKNQRRRDEALAVAEFLRET